MQHPQSVQRRQTERSTISAISTKNFICTRAKHVKSESIIITSCSFLLLILNARRQYKTSFDYWLLFLLKSFPLSCCCLCLCLLAKPLNSLRTFVIFVRLLYLLLYSLTTQQICIWDACWSLTIRTNEYVGMNEAKSNKQPAKREKGDDDDEEQQSSEMKLMHTRFKVKWIEPTVRIFIVPESINDRI